MAHVVPAGPSHARSFGSARHSVWKSQAWGVDVHLDKARLKLLEAKEDMQLEDYTDEAFVSVAQREQLKQDSAAANDVSCAEMTCGEILVNAGILAEVQ